MPNVFGRDVQTLDEILSALEQHGDKVRGTYVARYVWTKASDNPYAGTTLERPASLRGNRPDVVFPWEQIFLAAATCAGSDYPVFAQTFGVSLERVELVVEGIFDPRPEFLESAGTHCFESLHLRASLVSSAPREALERLHERVLKRNMVLDALRGIPRTSALAVQGK